MQVTSDDVCGLVSLSCSFSLFGLGRNFRPRIMQVARKGLVVTIYRS